MSFKMLTQTTSSVFQEYYTTAGFFEVKLTLLIFLAVLLPTLKISPGPPLVIAAIPPAFFARNKPAAVIITLDVERRENEYKDA